MIVAASFLILQQLVAERQKKGRERKVESRLGYSFNHCCMMFNMPDRGRLAEAKKKKCCRNEELRRKSFLHPFFILPILPYISFAFLSRPRCLSLLSSYVFSLSFFFFLSPHSFLFPSILISSFWSLCVCVCVAECTVRVDL